MWMNGYAHGKAGDTMFDGDKAEANAAKVAAYCKENQAATLASAIDAVSKM
jgi:acid stress chaperone HdeB